MIRVVNKLIFCLTLILCILQFGCYDSYKKNKQSKIWDPDIRKLSDFSNKWPGLTKDIRSFYSALHEKDWPITYDYRTYSFKVSVRRKMYLDAMRNQGQNWELLDYKVLSVDMFGNNKARLMMEFLEGGMGQQRSFSVVWWKLEGSSWRCEEAGPSILSLFRRISAPEE